jgi:hypothetical protein
LGIKDSELEKTKDTGKWCEYHKIPWHNTEECRSKQSLVVELTTFESEVDFDSESNPEGGKQIVDDEPSATVSTTKVRPSEPEEPEEGECLFHSQMWVKGAPIHFIVDSGSCRKSRSYQQSSWSVFDQAKTLSFLLSQI